MNKTNIGILLCLFFVTASYFYIFSNNEKVDSAELEEGQPIEIVLVPAQISEQGCLAKIFSNTNVNHVME